VRRTQRSTTLVSRPAQLHDALVERSPKWGLRFDRVNQECYGNEPSSGGNTWAYHGTMENNVVWNCNGLMVKGNNHTINRNTVFGTSPLNFENDGQQRDIAVYSYNDFGACPRLATDGRPASLAFLIACPLSPDTPPLTHRYVSVYRLVLHPQQRDVLCVGRLQHL
jgi:hypothetical protein